MDDIIWKRRLRKSFSCRCVLLSCFLLHTKGKLCLCGTCGMYWTGYVFSLLDTHSNGGKCFSSHLLQNYYTLRSVLSICYISYHTIFFSVIFAMAMNKRYDHLSLIFHSKNRLFATFQQWRWRKREKRKLCIKNVMKWWGIHFERQQQRQLQIYWTVIGMVWNEAQEVKEKGKK